MGASCRRSLAYVAIIWHRHRYLRRPSRPSPPVPRTIGSSVFFWNWTRRTRVTLSMSTSPFGLSASSLHPLKWEGSGGGVMRIAFSPYTSCAVTSCAFSTLCSSTQQIVNSTGPSVDPCDTPISTFMPIIMWLWDHWLYIISITLFCKVMLF